MLKLNFQMKFSNEILKRNGNFRRPNETVKSGGKSGGRGKTKT